MSRITVVDFFKKTFSTPRSRALLLFAFPFVLTVSFFVVISSSSINVFSPTSTYSIIASKENQTTIKTSDFIDEFLKFIHLPNIFVNFNIYAINNTVAKTQSGRELSTYLNVSVFGQYTGNIKSGQVKMVFSGINLIKSPTTSIERSFQIIDYDGMDPALPSDNSTYQFFLLPTFFSVVFTWIAVTVVWYGVLVLVSLLLKFVLTGSPFK